MKKTCVSFALLLAGVLGAGDLAYPQVPRRAGQNAATTTHVRRTQ